MRKRVLRRLAFSIAFFCIACFGAHSEVLSVLLAVTIGIDLWTLQRVWDR